MPKIEVLAPVGNRAMLDAALAAGADAVYLGGKTGNARAFAGNFDNRDLAEAVFDCHMRGVKVYLTLNTLVKQIEMDEILQFADEAVSADIDAVILQDIGLFHNLRQRYPDLSLHASTQMNFHSLAGALQAERMGFDRIIAGRETTLQELTRIRDGAEIEVELFVHGSLCVSVSGQCLLSGLIGGRSGNRGRCAQPCRKAYRGLSGKWDTWLSLRDLNTLEHMDIWKTMHVRSLKIEGRMKKPEYVYAVTKMVKAAIDEKPVDTNLLDVSSRAFTKGFNLGDFGRSAAQIATTQRGSIVGNVVVARGRKEIQFRTDSTRGDTLQIETEKGKEILITTTRSVAAGNTYRLDRFSDARAGSPVRRIYAQQIQDALQADRKKGTQLPLHLVFSGNVNTPAVLSAESGTHRVHVEGDRPVQRANKKPVSREDIQSRLERTGGTDFATPTIDIHWGNGWFLPLGDINRMRRSALDKLQQEIAMHYDRKPMRLKPLRTFHGAAQPELRIEIDDNRLMDSYPMESITRVYTADIRDIAQYKQKWKCAVYLILPEPADEKAEAFARAHAADFDGILAKDLAGAQIAKTLGLPVQFDASIHCMNDHCARWLLDYGENAGITASLEMSGQEMEEADFIQEAEVIAFGPVVAMKLRQCPFAVEKGCIDDTGCAHCAFAKSMLTDSHGAAYYVERKGKLSHLYFNAWMNRIERFAHSKNHPLAYRLILREDSSGAAWIRYAADRLIGRTQTQQPEGSGFWKMEEWTDARWDQGVE